MFEMEKDKKDNTQEFVPMVKMSKTPFRDFNRLAEEMAVVSKLNLEVKRLRQKRFGQKNYPF